MYTITHIAQMPIDQTHACEIFINGVVAYTLYNSHIREHQVDAGSAGWRYMCCVYVRVHVRRDA